MVKSFITLGPGVKLILKIPMASNTVSMKGQYTDGGINYANKSFMKLATGRTTTVMDPICAETL
jgi:hypothetical protein